MTLQPGQRLLVAAGFVAILVYASPARVLLLPLLYLNTHLHELWHALAGLATGGSVRSISVFSDGSGVTLIAGGSPVIVSSAGYIGSAAMGAWLIVMGRAAKSARKSMWALFGILAGSMLLFVRGDAVGVLTGFIWCFAFAGLARFLAGTSVAFAAQCVGMLLSLSAAESFSVLWQASLQGATRSDAANMQNLTGIPAVVWAALWFLISLAAMGYALVLAWGHRNPSRSSP